MPLIMGVPNCESGEGEVSSEDAIKILKEAEKITMEICFEGIKPVEEEIANQLKKLQIEK